MSFTTVPQSTLPKNRPTPTQVSLSGYQFRTAPYDAYDPGPWLWRADPSYQRDLRTGRHRRDEAPDPRPDAPSHHQVVAIRDLAWARFLESSAPLAQAHISTRLTRPPLRKRLTRALRVAAAILRGAPSPTPAQSR